MALQMKPELSWAELKRLTAFRDGIDAQKGRDNKIKYANEHSLVKTAPYDTFTISYVGNLPWGGISDYVDSVFSITDGHLLQELHYLPGKFCLAFQQLVEDKKYLNAFLQVLEEEHLNCEVGEMEAKKLAAIKL